jgi:hypothetical protein
MRQPFSEVTRYGWALLAVVDALDLRSFRTPFPNDTVPYLAVRLPLSSLPGTDAVWEEK